MTLNQPRHRFQICAAGENILRQRPLVRAQVILQQSLEHGAQIGGRLEIAVLVEIGGLQARPIGDHAPAFERATGEERNRRGAVVGAFGAVDARGAAELGDQRHYRLMPCRPHIGFDRGKCAVERAEQLREAAVGNALVGVRIPAVERQCADPRPVGLPQKFRRGACGLGKITAHLRRTGASRLLRHVAGMLNRCEPGALVDRGGKPRVGMAIGVEQALHGVGARRLHPLRRPRQHRRWAAHHERRHRADGKGFGAMRVDTAAGRKTRERAIEPARVAHGRFRQAAFENALPVEMRALASLWQTFHSETLARIIRRPATAWTAFCGSIAFWHLPRLYRIAVNDEGLHVIMHLSFLAAGLLFWSVVLEPSGKRRLDFGRSILFVFSAAMVTGIPGALLIFARRVMYQDPNAAMTFGLSPLEDQQLAGLIMWIPMDLVLFGVAGALFVAWLSSADRRQLANAAAHAGRLLLILYLLSGCGESGNVEAHRDLDGNRSQGAALIVQYGCGTCHEITGIPGAYGLVGPSLDHFGRRIYIAGMLRNSPDNLIRWLQNPQAIVPGNVMPNMHISKVDADDIAAYLLTLQ